MPPSGGKACLPRETQAGKSGGSIPNEARGNLASCMSEDGRAEIGTVKAFTWPREVAWKVVRVTLPNRKLIPLKAPQSSIKPAILLNFSKLPFFLEK